MPSDDFAVRLQVSDSGFAFDPQTGSTFSLNRTGVRVLQMLRDGQDKEQIVAEIAREFSLDASAALRDVEDFMVSLKGFETA